MGWRDGTLIGEDHRLAVRVAHYAAGVGAMKTSRYAFWYRIGRCRATVGRSTAVLGKGRWRRRKERERRWAISQRPRWKCMVGQEEEDERWW
jgi:hypothetical protein